VSTKESAVNAAYRAGYLWALTGASIVPTADSCKCHYRPFATMIAIFIVSRPKKGRQLSCAGYFGFKFLLMLDTICSICVRSMCEYQRIRMTPR
jgi:hypothetical protein